MSRYQSSIMHGFSIWHVLCVLGSLGSSLCANEVEYEGNYADNYDNEISQNQQEEESQPTPCHADFSRWDKLFIALEDSHMRQKMLLESVEQCCGGMHSLKTQLGKLAKGTWQQNASSLVSACRAQAEQSSLRLHHNLAKLREEEEERERTINMTLQMILRSSHEENSRLRHLEEAMPLASAGSRNSNQPTPRPGGLGTAGVKPFLFGLKGQEVTLPMDMATMESALVAIATDLQRVHLQLSKVIEQAGTLRKDRGDT
ncbi:pentraxin-related protein PTX3-like [Melanotaenia boesemani]|uniref:pentraxin-related protein PTX3-like n=1 Tax=Melanotaenia boesemani TaxID=1250792 RepID=UPI001C0438F7|nr:pentraxin-related protein PTX3-like [Melanotaenia boesemani]